MKLIFLLNTFFSQIAFSALAMIIILYKYIFLNFFRFVQDDDAEVEMWFAFFFKGFFCWEWNQSIGSCDFLFEAQKSYLIALNALNCNSNQRNWYLQSGKVKLKNSSNGDYSCSDLFYGKEAKVNWWIWKKIVK